MMIPAHALSGLICLHLGQILVKRTDGTSRWTKTPRWAWLVLGLSLAFLSHALIDAMAIFTYHDSSPSGSIFSRLAFWGWFFSGVGIITWAVWKDVRYSYGILVALSYDIWDHCILRFGSGVLDGFPEGFMVRYTNHFEALQLHQLEWLLLDNFLVGIERHYGDPRFLTVEIIFVLILVTSLVHLRSSRPLNSN